MRIVEMKERNSELIENLLDVWENSVKATHLFLSDDEINNIRQYVPQALKGVPVLVIEENENVNLANEESTSENFEENVENEEDIVEIKENTYGVLYYTKQYSYMLNCENDIK